MAGRNPRNQSSSGTAGNRRMVAARTFFARMNEGRSSWLSEAQLAAGCEEFFSSNGFAIERNRVFGESTRHSFASPIVGTRTSAPAAAPATEAEGGDGDSPEKEVIAAYIKPRLDRYDIGFFGALESALFEVVDNYEYTSLMLATDSLSYMPITKTEELSVTVENLMDEGLYLLFVNGRSAHALFDDFDKLTMPIPVSD